MASYIVRSFDNTLKKVEYPDMLKIAKVIPLHKGSSKQTSSNYRPISVLTPINKIYKTLLKKSV